MSYEMDDDSFVLRILSIPSQGSTLDLAEEMLKETKKIEANLI
jgi:hypothetical protein